MAEANHQDLAMEQDPENVLLKEDERNEMDKETQEHVNDDLKTGDGVQAVAAELDKDADVELQEAEVVQVDDVQVHTAEVVQVTEMLQEDQVMQPDCGILPAGDEGHLGEWMQDGKSFEGQAGDPVQIPDLEKLETVPVVNMLVKCLITFSLGSVLDLWWLLKEPLCYCLYSKTDSPLKYHHLQNPNTVLSHLGSASVSYYRHSMAVGSA